MLFRVTFIKQRTNVFHKNNHLVRTKYGFNFTNCGIFLTNNYYWIRFVTTVSANGLIIKLSWTLHENLFKYIALSVRDQTYTYLIDANATQRAAK